MADKPMDLNIAVEQSRISMFFVVVVTALLAWVGYAHISHGANVKAQFVVLFLAFFGGALCWIWSNTLRLYRAQLRTRSEASDAETWNVRSESFTLNDHRVPLLLSVFFAIIALMAIGRIL